MGKKRKAPARSKQESSDEESGPRLQNEVRKSFLCSCKFDEDDIVNDEIDAFHSSRAKVFL